MTDDIPLVGKKPTIGDYLRSGSCTGEPQVGLHAYLTFDEKQIEIVIDFMTLAIVSF